MTTLIRNIRLVSPDLEIGNSALLLENGLIREVFTPDSDLPAADTVTDGGGRTAMPGFIDIHSHGADGHDIGDNTAEAVRQIARRKLQEGVTTWLPTTLTQAPEVLLEIAGHCAGYMAAQESCRVPGLHVEGPFINPKNAGAQNPEYVRLPDFAELERLHQKAQVRILSLAPEMPGALDLIRSATGQGIVCSAAHTSARAADIAQAKEGGLTHLTHFGNAMTGLHHREIGVVGTGLVDDSLMLELICDGIHLSPDMLKLVFKLVPIERLMLITDSMAASWMGDGEVSLGGLPVLVKEGEARLKSNGSLAGSALRFNEGVRNVARITGLPLDQIVKATSWNQARSLGLEGFGKLEAGYHADIVLLEEDFSVWKTFVAGKQL
ncbi:MAG: N-acetylglucosamine-6-phosphate deacetylase [Verrucomicrobiaceae bacterium]|nr:MAG: N-acetylglucosamine-6-phosphate deacetylase [Verrucomicrobiaceae bacterium]